MVHYLFAGLAVCGAGAPSNWSSEDRWIGPGNGSKSDVTCNHCKQTLNQPQWQEQKLLILTD